MKRTSLTFAFAIAAVFLASPWVDGQVVPNNPLRSASTSTRSPSSAATVPQAAPVTDSKTTAASEPQAAVEEPSPIRAVAHAEPIDRQPVGPPAGARSTRGRAVRAAQYNAPRRGTGSPFRLLQYGVRVPQHATPGYRPAHTRGGASFIAQEQPVAPEPIPEGAIIDGEIIDGEMGVVGPDCCGGTGCQACGGIQCPSFNNFEFFAGVHGFTGIPNRGETASFGFDYGFNWGAPLWCLTNGEVGVQAGFRQVSSNYDGASYARDTRHQYFLTGGFFRRVDYGLQGGAVVDYLGESWYYNADMMQVRAELSWMFPACHELGVWVTANMNDSNVSGTVLNSGNGTAFNDTFRSIDQYRFFYRRRFEDCGAEGRFSAGFTGDGDGILGADFQLPISDSWAAEATFTYLIPQGDASSGAFANEAWNVAVGLVWYPGMRKARGRDYFRPLFDVADNGSFIIGRP